MWWFFANILHHLRLGSLDSCITLLIVANMDVNRQLNPVLDCIGNAIHIITSALDRPLLVSDPIQELGERTLAALRCDHERMIKLASNMMCACKYSEVPICWVRLYEDAQLFAIGAMKEDLPTVLAHGCPIEEVNASLRGPLLAEIDDTLTKIVRRLDMTMIKTQGIGRKQVIHEALRALDMFSSSPTAETNEGEDDEFFELMRHPDGVDAIDQQAFFKMPSEASSTPDDKQAARDVAMRTLMPVSVAASFESETDKLPCIQHPIDNLPAMLSADEQIEEFRRHRETNDAPVVIRGGAADWPAVRAWRDPAYWLRQTHGGRRMVPIELGSKYTDEEWSQKILDVRTFVTRYLCHTSKPSRSEQLDKPLVEPPVVGYLAQHEFFTQIPEFYRDIRIPDLCYVSPSITHLPDGDVPTGGKRKRNHSMLANTSEDLDLPLVTTAQDDQPLSRQGSSSEVTARQADSCNSRLVDIGENILNEYDDPQRQREDDDGENDELGEIKINIWLGPANTVSPAHTDPHHNILAQAMGRKYVRLYGPQLTTCMYPMTEQRRQEGGQGNDKPNVEDFHMLQYHAEIATSETCSVTDEVAQDGTESSETVDMTNTSQVDVGVDVRWEDEDDAVRNERLAKRAEHLERYPRFVDAFYQECILEPGDCLFIPKGWWHYVQSLSVSASVSFWWD